MKDRIFLIWSGDNSAALKVKHILENEYNYICYVGGSRENGMQMLSVGDTVIRQMKTCNQAIVFFKNKKDSGVSENLYFELGYVSSSYGMKKVHCVKYAGDEIMLPSDFDNSFIEGIVAASEDEFAKKVVDYFIARQKLSVETNKMYLINNRYLIHEMIQSHYSEYGSRCSDYELAQYVLFYMQAAVMFQDDADVLEELRDFKRLHHTEFSPELNQAVNLSIALLGVQTDLVEEGGIVYLPEDSFRAYFNACKNIPAEIKNDASGIYDEWASVIALENLAYACALFASNPALGQEERTVLFQKTVTYGERCLRSIENLTKVASTSENNDNSGLISVFRAYIYRHLFTANKEIDKEAAEKWLDASMRERHALLRNFDKNSVDSQIYDNFEMEYYLNLIEYIAYVGKAAIDPFDYVMYSRDIEAFVAKCESRESKNVYIRTIASRWFGGHGEDASDKNE